MGSGHIPFKLNYGSHLCVFFEDDVDPYLKSFLANKLAKELRDLISTYQQNLLYAQKLQKQTKDKSIQPRSYVLGEKVWLNNMKAQSKVFLDLWSFSSNK